MVYRVIIFIHLIGVIILGGALIYGQMHQIRARRNNDIHFIAETYRTLYLTIIPLAPIGGIILLLSGAAIIYIAGFHIRGWLFVLLLIFGFEIIEGTFHYIPHTKRLMKLSQDAAGQGRLTPELYKLMNNKIANLLLYLDIPNFLAIVALSVFKPF